MTVMAVAERKSNAELIEDIASLGYIYGNVLDCTYGLGTFWKKYCPRNLITSDLKPYSDIVADFTNLPFPNRSFDCIVFDPPYKLNGTDQGEGERYGVETPTRWQDRMELIRNGLNECARVLDRGYLLLKCQDQVCSGKVRWQTIEFANHAEYFGLGLVDRLDIMSYRPQPEDRRQLHARRNTSTMLIFKRGW